MHATFVTMGDARGIGPEVALKALDRWGGAGRVRLVGVPQVWERVARELGLGELYERLEPDLLPIRAGGSGAGTRDDRSFREARSAGEPIPLPQDSGGSAELRALDPAVAGAWAGRSIETAVAALLDSDGDALVTAPLDKAALQAGGYRFPGHTEMLAALSGASTVAMMLVARDLRVTLVTGHVSLRKATDGVTQSAIRDAFLHTERALRTGFGVPSPRIAVCGLNPHAGDHGVLGDEEERVVAPAVATLRDAGFLVEGPLPADTVFVRAVAGEFDAVLALYHDQGMIPVKLHGFGSGVNVTLGLPFVRTSPDHGTALDIAGSGRASAESFLAALRLAGELSARPEFTARPA